MKRRWRVASLVPLLVALAACSSDRPLAPGTYSISGHLRLTGYLVDPDGRFAGTRVIGDADGVPVELLYGSEIVARTTTVDGRYRFTGLRPGGYVVRGRVIPSIEDETRPMVIANRDVEAAETLRVASLGDIYPVPNPFADTLKLFFQVYDSAHVTLEIRDVGGRPLRTLLDLELRRGMQTVIWPVGDPDGQFPIDALFWVTLHSGPDTRAQLLFRRPRPLAAPAAPGRKSGVDMVEVDSRRVRGKRGLAFANPRLHPGEAAGLPGDAATASR